jgi:hypothetical protein
MILPAPSSGRMGLGVSMSDLRKAAQQALEAWERLGNRPILDIDDKFDALRAALSAQPEPAAPTVGGPVAWGCFKNGALQTELIDDNKRVVDFWIASDEPHMQGMTIEPLYLASPPRREWQGLTEKDIRNIANGLNGVQPPLSQWARDLKLARAIEAAHGIGKAVTP